MVRSSDYGFTVGTGNAGYIGGGGYAPNTSLIDRIDYSKSATALARGPSISKYGMAAMGNADFGYWSASTWSSNISRSFGLL